MAARKCLKQDGQDYQDGQDKEGVLLVTYPLACCWRCRCLKQDGQDIQDGQDKEGFSCRPISRLLAVRVWSV